MLSIYDLLLTIQPGVAGQAVGYRRRQGEEGQAFPAEELCGQQDGGEEAVGTPQKTAARPTTPPKEGEGPGTPETA